MWHSSLLAFILPHFWMSIFTAIAPAAYILLFIHSSVYLPFLTTCYIQPSRSLLHCVSQPTVRNRFCIMTCLVCLCVWLKWKFQWTVLTHTQWHVFICSVKKMQKWWLGLLSRFHDLLTGLAWGLKALVWVMSHPVPNCVLSVIPRMVELPSTVILSLEPSLF